MASTIRCLRVIVTGNLLSVDALNKRTRLIGDELNVAQDKLSGVAHLPIAKEVP